MHDCKTILRILAWHAGFEASRHTLFRWVSFFRPYIGIGCESYSDLLDHTFWLMACRCSASATTIAQIWHMHNSVRLSVDSASRNRLINNEDSLKIQQMLSHLEQIAIAFGLGNVDEVARQLAAAIERHVYQPEDLVLSNLLEKLFGNPKDFESAELGIAVVRTTNALHILPDLRSKLKVVSDNFPDLRESIRMLK